MPSKIIADTNLVCDCIEKFIDAHISRSLVIEDQPNSAFLTMIPLQLEVRNV